MILPFHAVCYLFFCYKLQPLSLCVIVDSISSNIDEPFANAFVFGEINVETFVVSFLIYFKLKGGCHFKLICDYSHADQDGRCDNSRDLLWGNIFKFSTSTVATEFCE